MLREQIFSDISNYPKPVNPDWQSAVAEYLEEVGATDLDAPDAPKRKVQRTDAQLRELEGIERAKAEARAQAEHQAALARLNDGTAVLRQPREGTVLPSKKQVAKAGQKVTGRALEYKNAKKRRAPIIEKLNAGEFVEVMFQGKKKVWDGGYQQQHYDIMHIKKRLGLKVVRVRCNQRKKSFYAVDNFPRHTPAETISGMTNNKKELLQALLTRELVLASDLVCTAPMAARTVMTIMKEHDLDIYTVFDGPKITGWMFIPDKEKQKAKLKEVGDLLQALDFLEERKLRKENDRLPMHVPDVILDAAYREFKRVAKDAGATIEELLAVKEGQ